MQPVRCIPNGFLQLVEKHRLQPRLGEYLKNLSMTRYYSEHFFTAPAWETIAQ